MKHFQRLFAALLWASLAAAQIVPGHYIVELSGEPVAVGAARVPVRWRADFARDRRSMIRAEQGFVRRILERYQTSVLDSVDTVANALLVKMPDHQAAWLGSLPGIRRIRPVYEIKLALEHAIPLHKVPEAWTRLGGGDLAGAGAKIAIIDTGIDHTHPGFVDPSIPMPEGFPRANQASDLEFTSNKVIVARSYLRLFGTESDVSARDTDGHGTGVAMAAAGVIQDTGSGIISGVAPKAWLGSYNVFHRDGGTTRLDIVLKAFDDAVADGMDVINLSLGSPYAMRPNDDIFTAIVERATGMGVLVVVAAGNSGPDPFTMADFAVAPSAISVGASWNDRVLSGSVSLESGEQYLATPGDGPNPDDPIAAPLHDVAELDPSGLLCGNLTAGSLLGHIAFILRGTCFFEDKLNNAQAAGAIGAVVYTHADEPDAITMAVGSATLPASMVSHEDGLEIKDLLGANGNPVATIDFRQIPVAVDPNRIASFSSAGPSTDFGIKPDIVATGVALHTATLGGFGFTQGTSVSAPIVAGAAAVLKAARPGYSGHHYRSMLINAATPLVLDSGDPVSVQKAGGGVLNLETAMASTVTAYPTSVSFGTTVGTVERNLTIFNLGTVEDTFAISVEPYGGGAVPTVSSATVLMSPRSARTVTLSFAGQGLPGGAYQGTVWIQGSRPGTDIHVPYWYGAPSDTPANLTILQQEESGTPGAFLRGAIVVRTTDVAGIPLALAPTVSVVSGGGSVVSVISLDSISPGLFDVNVRLGSQAGGNVFRVEAGGLTEEVTIQGGGS